MATLRLPDIYVLDKNFKWEECWVYHEFNHCHIVLLESLKNTFDVTIGSEDNMANFYH